MNEFIENTNISFYDIFLNDVNKKIIHHPQPNEKVLNNSTYININVSYIYVGLGLESYPKKIYDLDISIICFDRFNNYDTIINFNNQISLSNLLDILLFDDNRIGNGKEDDEKIYINLHSLNRNNIYSLAVIINNFKGFKLNELKSSYVRIYTDNQPIGCYPFGNTIEENGLLFGFFKGSNDINSYFDAIYSPLKIDKIENSLDEIRQILINSFN